MSYAKAGSDAYESPAVDETKTWVKCNSQHPDSCSEYDVIFASEVLHELARRDRRIAELEAQKPDYQYPRDIFNKLIKENSPYATYIFQWVPYQTDAKRRRLKMCHDVRTFDGREALGIWPNADHCGPFHDDEVEFIRISKDQNWGAWTDTMDAPPEQEEGNGDQAAD